MFFIILLENKHEIHLKILFFQGWVALRATFGSLRTIKYLGSLRVEAILGGGSPQIFVTNDSVSRIDYYCASPRLRAAAESATLKKWIHMF